MGIKATAKARTTANVKANVAIKAVRSPAMSKRDTGTTAKNISTPKSSGSARRGRTMKNQTRLTRLEARVPEQLNNKILKAASLKGTSKTDFLVFALDEVASRVILEESTLQLHIDDQKTLAEVILADKPHPPVRKMSRLRKYAEEYTKRVERK